MQSPWVDPMSDPAGRLAKHRGAPRVTSCEPLYPSPTARILSKQSTRRRGPWFLPLIPLVLIGTGAVTGSTGLYAGGRGAYKLKQAKKQVLEATDSYNAERTRTEAAAAVTNARLTEYGQTQQAALDATVARMSAFIRRNQRQVKSSVKQLLDGFEVEINECERAKALSSDPLTVISALATAGTTGVGAAAGTTAAISTWGVASTGTAISTLSGAAAESAILAALGGGSLAAGGGGVALGATALNFVTAGPALLIGGIVLNSKGEKALTQAKEFTADTRLKQADVAALRSLFGGVEQRADEMDRILDDLVLRAVAAMDTLESLDPVRRLLGARPRRRVPASDGPRGRST